jgi:hypothetical protein
MKISEAMLDAAIRKAAEVGLFPRHLTDVDRAISRDLMRVVIEAALQASDDETYSSAQASSRSEDRWSFFASK